jgi:hypothetical protein
MKSQNVKITDCSCADIVKIAQNCGFIVEQGGKHCKVMDFAGRFIVPIPRHNHVKRETAKSIFKKLIEHGANIEIC